MKGPVRRCTRSIAALLADRAGVTALEFGMVGLPFLMLILATMSTGFVLFTQSSLDYGTQKAARQIMVGTVQTSNLTADQFRTQTLCPLLPVTFSCNDVIVSLQTVTNDQSSPTHYYDFVNAAHTALLVPLLSNATTKFCSGGSGEYKLLQVYYTLPVYLTIFADSAQVVNYKGNTLFLLTSTAAFKNEPFSSTGYTAPAGC